MFFNSLFKNKVGNREKVVKGIFGLAVIVNILGVALPLLILLAGVYNNFKNFYRFVGLAGLVLFIAYVIVLLLAALSTALNKEESKKVTKKETK